MRWRIPLSALLVVACTLSVSLDELFGEDKTATRAKRGPVPQCQQHIEAIAQLPKARQRFVAEILQTVLAQRRANSRCNRGRVSGPCDNTRARRASLFNESLKVKDGSRIPYPPPS